MKAYLKSGHIIDWQHPDVMTQARVLADDSCNDIEITRRCFEFVRDTIDHSGDARRDDPACKASEVLKQGTGWCYAKSHLLAALLRARQIPAGLCYQRLTVEGDHAPFCLHGLNAVYLKKHGWYRLDARGNKHGVTASFSPPQEALAFPIQHPGEADINGIFAEPLAIITETLQNRRTYSEVKDNLPDIELWSASATPNEVHREN